MGTVNPGLFTSTSHEWSTPRPFFDRLDAEFGFTLDACASVGNAKCARFFDRATDGLSRRWHGVVWMNPPYGRQIGHWVRKAHAEAMRGATVVCLIPARTETAYWHEHVMAADEVRFIRGRLTFVLPEQALRVSLGESRAHNAPFPSVVVVFRGGGGPPAVSTLDRDGSTRRLETA